MNNLNVQARYNWNAQNGFVADVLKFDTNWNSDRVDGQLSSERTGTTPMNYGNNRVRQHFDRPQLTVSNTFNTIRNIGKNTFDLHFSAGYAHRPNTLTVKAPLSSPEGDTIVPAPKTNEAPSGAVGGALGVSTSFRVRVWERGSGITQACGTGACATAVAACVMGRAGRQVQIVMDGGTLGIEWRESDNHVYMTGPAAFVFDGEVEIP